MKPDFESKPGPSVSLPVSLLVCIAAAALMIWARVSVFDDRIFPLSAALPLLLCLWNRDLRVLYGMAAVLSALTIYKITEVIPERTLTRANENLAMATQLCDIWIFAGVLHAVIRHRRQLVTQARKLSELNAELEAGNEELSASNEELAAREEEISRQNEELQCQAEELEQQSEELRQQTEEMEQQSSNLQHVNEELSRRERGLQILLESGRWLRGDLSEAVVMNGICDAALQILGDAVHASCVVENRSGRLHLRGDSGFGLHGAVTPDIPFADTFAALIYESGRTASLEDVANRPDLQLPKPGAGRPFRAILGSPIWYQGKVIAALEVFSHRPRQWSEDDFKVIEWLAAQAALALQSLRFQQELEQKREAAEQASLQKSRFLAAVSHDVRTPANAISLLAELIERCADDPERIQQVPKLAHDLGSNARSMIDLVSDVLDLTRFDTGVSDLEVSDFSLTDLVEGEHRQSSPVAEKKGLRLSIELPASPIRLRTDRTKLQRVIGNLVGNALKFTEHGEVRIHGEILDDGGFALHVIDTGVGIPSDKVEHVFDEFFQLQNPERNRDKGAGLGLAICRRLLDSLGGTLGVKSLVGVGSTFSIRLPATLLSAKPETPDRKVSGDLSAIHERHRRPAREAPKALLDGVRILLVEDHETARKTTSALLAAEGAEIFEAATGREALNLLSSCNPDILLLDLNLPDFDGTEILKSLQASRCESLSSIFVVSGDVRPERIEEVKLLGADELIPKPVDIEKLKSALSSQRPDLPLMN
ncbi:ATP-binding protein [Haloferula sargassicola]|uniref:histidine kinase n=1 Tax=Haloferula sargassicola TaxID=490096 RepID=A0ABP9UIZ9_9BACT